MVKKTLSALALACGVLFATTAMADGKVAVLGVQEALLSTKAAKQYREELKSELKTDQDRILELEMQAKKIRERLQKEGSSMSKDEADRARLQFQKAFEEYQRSSQQIQQKQAQKEQEFLEMMRPKMDAIIRELIDSNEYDIIIAKQATVYARKQHDITKRVVDMLNNR